MPREQINHAPIIIKHEGTPNERHEALDAICAAVGWNRAGWAQVSLSLSRSRLQQLANEYSELPSDEVSLYSEVLTRTELNKMIKTLRKARDQAYGADA